MDIPKITITPQSKGKTKITIYPDFKRFNMVGFESGILELLTKRVYDIAGSSSKTLKVKLNGLQIPINNFRSYCSMYISNELKLAHEIVNKRWEILVSCVENGTSFEQVSYVNSIWTRKGGTHVKYIADQISGKII